MSVTGLCPVPPLDSSQACRFAPELLAAAECLRQLALRHPGRVFSLPYLSASLSTSRAYGPAYYSVQVLEFRVDSAGWINYHDIRIMHGEREEVEPEVRRRKPPLADRIMEAEGVLGWANTARAYTAALEYLEESGYLRRACPDLRERAEAALTLARLL